MEYLEEVLERLAEKLNMRANEDIDECRRRTMTLFDETDSNSMVMKIGQHIIGFRAISLDGDMSESANNPEMVLMVQCLNYHTLDEDLQNYFAWETNGGESHRKRITDPPEIVIIRLIRNRYGRNLRRKDCELVSFQGTLDIREFTVGDEI